MFVDDMYVFGGNVQMYEVFFGFDLEMVVLQVWQEMVVGFVVCVGNVIFGNWIFIGYLIDFRYVLVFYNFMFNLVWVGCFNLSLIFSFIGVLFVVF